MKRIGAILSMVAVIAAAVPPPVAAANFGSTACGGDPRNCVNIADNATHTWYPDGTLGNQVPGIGTAVQTAMDHLEYYTVIDAQKKTSSTLDVLVADAFYPQYVFANSAILAWVECLPDSSTTGTNPNRRCDRQKLRFNGSAPAFFNNSTRRLSLACHEIGHTVGLRHPDGDGSSNVRSCMETPFDPNSAYTVTSTHDDAHINSYYG